MNNQPKTLCELLAASKSKFSDRSFLQSADAKVQFSFNSYHELVCRIADQLGELGVRNGDHVALLLDSAPAAMAVTMGILWGSAVAVPLHPGLKKSELLGLLGHSETHWIVVASAQKEELLSWLPEASLEKELTYQGLDLALAIISLGRASGRLERQGDQVVKPESPALLLYTSGTTGKSKAAILTHRNLSENVHFVAQHYQITAADKTLCILPLHHIHGLVVSFLVPLCTGCTIVLAGPNKMIAPKIWEYVNRLEITWFSTVPAMIAMILKSPVRLDHRPKKFRFVRVGSAPLSASDLSGFEAKFGVPVIAGYGLTEASCVATSNPLPPGVRKPGSAGRPIGNLQLRIVDDEGKPLQNGATGEIILKGDCVFPGYFHNAEANAASIKEGWFHTGDLGHVDDDGYLFITDRKHDLINVSGEKVSPKEVEDVISTLSGVEAVVVIGLPHAISGESVAACIQTSEHISLSSEQIRQFCAGRLTEYKIPKQIFFVNDFPRNNLGKIERKILARDYAK